MDYKQQLLYEFQMKKNKKQKNKKKNKRNLKKAIKISHTQQTALVEGYYEVESIEKIKSFGKYDLRFYIKWKGWSDGDNTWEPFQNVRNCFFNLKEFYEKSYDNKKITNSDAWKMFVGCLECEHLIDDQGKFRDQFRRKYAKRKREEGEDDNISSEIPSQNIHKKSTRDQEDDSSGEQNEVDSSKLKLKLEEQDESVDEEDSEDNQIKERMKENLKLKKKISKKKKLLSQHSQYGEEKKKGKDEGEEVKQKRKYKTKKYLQELEKKKDEIQMKGKKFKRTYSSLLTKRQRKPKNIDTQKLQDLKPDSTPYQEIETKIEEGEENYEGIRFNQVGANYLNKLNSVNLVENKERNNTSSQDNLTPQGGENIQLEKSKQNDKQQNKASQNDIENNDPNVTRQRSQKQLKERDINGKSNFINVQLEENSDSNGEGDEDDDDDDDEEEVENSTNLKARGFSALQGENQRDESAIEPNITKKRKNELNEMHSSLNFGENKQQNLLNSFHELDLIQPERQLLLNAENNAFGSNHNITSDILGNSDISIIAQRNKKFQTKISELFTEEGSISGGKNQIHSFDNLNNPDQLVSEQFLDKMHNESHLFSQKCFNFGGSDRLSNPLLRHANSHPNYLNKLNQQKLYGWSNTLSHLSLLTSTPEQLNSCGLDKQLSRNNTQRSFFEDPLAQAMIFPTDIMSASFPFQNQFNPLINQQSIWTPKQKQQEINNQKALQNQAKTITIEDDEEEDIVENSDHNYKLHSEREDKDKFTKIRLVKKLDSVEIQESQPYKHVNQYTDEIQKKKIRSCNYNDSQGQSGGLSKSLQELNKSQQPELKQQYQKYRKNVQQLQQSDLQSTKLQKQNSSLMSNGAVNNIPQYSDQTYEQFCLNQFQEVKNLKNPEIKDPQKTIQSLYEGNLSLKDEPNRIIAIDIHPYLIGQYIFKVTWAPRKKRDQLISSWVEGDKLKLKYPNLVLEFYESFIRFID